MRVDYSLSNCLGLAYVNPRAWPRQRQPSAAHFPLFFCLCVLLLPPDRLTENRTRCAIGRLSGFVFYRVCFAVLVRPGRPPYPSPLPTVLRFAIANRSAPRYLIKTVHRRFAHLAHLASVSPTSLNPTLARSRSFGITALFSQGLFLNSRLGCLGLALYTEGTKPTTLRYINE